MQWFDNIKIRSKHLLIFGLLMAMMISFAVFAVRQIITIGAKNNESIISYHTRQTLITDTIADAYVVRLANLSRGYTLEDDSFINAISRNLNASEQSARSFKEKMDELRGLVQSDPGKTEAEKHQWIVALDGVNYAFDRYTLISDRVKTAVENGEKEEVIRIYGDAIPAGNNLIDKLQDLRDMAYYNTMKNSLKTTEKTALAIKTVISLTAALVILSILLLLLTVKSINQPIYMMEKAVTEIAKGKLSYPVRIDRGDELGSLSISISQMVNKLSNQEQLEAQNAQLTRLTEALEEHGRRTSLLLDSMPYACHLWNSDHEMFECNEENARLFKLKDKKEVMERFYDFSPEYQPDGRLSSEVVTEYLTKAFTDGAFIGEYMHLTSDGAPLPVEMTLVRVAYGEGYVAAAYARDLREHKKMMEIIHNNAEKLEIAMKEAQNANSAKSEFLANISHEMRTPLNAVLGLTGLVLEMEGLEDEVIINLEKIYSSGATLLNIVNDILDISKIEAGKLEILPNKYDIPSLINDVITQNVLRIGSKLIEFTLDISPDVPAMLYGDELRIRQILNNLLTNAFKYTMEGNVELGMRAQRSDEDRTVWITAWVKDTGVGIRAEDIDKLFSDYSQVDTKANRKIEGTGLGLAITKKMLEMMHGAISVQSEYGKGSTFTIRFKQELLTDDIIGESVVKNLMSFRYSNAKRKQSLKITRVKMPYARVLVVDDNLTNLDVAKGLMKPYGMKVDCVTRGQRAIDAILADEGKYSAVFMDHMMPEMDGIEATRRIREIDSEYARNIPIIALTANAIAGSEKKFLSNGFQDFLSKPIDLPRLDDVLRRWVRNKEKEREFLEKEKEVILPEDAPTAKEEDTKVSAILSKYSIDGVDLANGLERFGNDADTYLSVLRSYTVNTRPVLEMMRNVSKDDISDYTINVHGLKGSSRGIFANPVADLAEKLEKASKNGDFDYVLSDNERLIGLTDKLIRDIEEMLAAIHADNPKRAKDAPDTDALRRLIAACEDYDIDSINDAISEIDKFEYGSEVGLADWLKDNLLEGNLDEIAERLASIVNQESAASG